MKKKDDVVGDIAAALLMSVIENIRPVIGDSDYPAYIAAAFVLAIEKMNEQVNPNIQKLIQLLLEENGNKQVHKEPSRFN